MAGPLDGVKVVEFTSVVLGPWACQTLGDMGADVIKVEPLVGDTNRNLGPSKTHSDMSALYLTCNQEQALYCPRSESLPRVGKQP